MMKKWQKWSLSIFGLLIAFIIIFVAWSWSWLSIVMGTEGLNGKEEAIPDIAGLKYESATKGDADWISWLGINEDNRSLVKGIKKDWSKGLTKVWEVDYLCQGDASATWSAPVIQGNHLIVCGRDTENDLVFCLDAADGSLLWQASYPAKAITSHGSGPRATPYIDDERVYTFGRSGDLVCWHLPDGKELWRRNVCDEGGEEPTWGFASSPLVHDRFVMVQGGGTARTIAYDKKTGDVIWKSGTGLAGYAALKMMTIAEKELLLAFHGKGLAALDVKSGHELWNVSWETQYDVNATTPLVINDNVFITSGYGTGGQLLKINSTEAKIVWRNEIFASQHSDTYSIDGYLYGYSGDSFQNKGTYKCIELKNGEEKWATNEMGWGTCTFVDGYLVCCDIKGNLFLMQPDPNEFIKVAELRNALGDIKGPVWTKPIIANGRLYLRFKQRLVSYNFCDDIQLISQYSYKSSENRMSISN